MQPLAIRYLVSFLSRPVLVGVSGTLDRPLEVSPYDRILVLAVENRLVPARVASCELVVGGNRIIEWCDSGVLGEL